MYWRRQKKFEPLAFWGLIVTAALHAALVGMVIFYRQQSNAAAEAPPPESYVVAQLVRLGKPKDAKFLPDRAAPVQAERPEETVDLSADEQTPQAVKKPALDRDAKVSDKLRRSLDRAELFSEAQKQMEDGEGSPDGVVGGTATRGSPGDEYITKIADLWIRNWTLPAIIPSEEAKQLYVLIVVRIDKDGNILFPITFDHQSGNSHFDNSIVAAWQRIRQIPVPPPEKFASIITNGLPLKLTWRGLQ